jgi:hypothetical protein
MRLTNRRIRTRVVEGRNDGCAHALLIVKVVEDKLLYEELYGLNRTELQSTHGDVHCMCKETLTITRCVGYEPRDP